MSTATLKRKRTRAPGPPITRLGRIIRGFQRDPLGLLTEFREQYGDIVRMRMGPYVAHLISDPEYIQHVLQRNYANYRKSIFYQEMKPFLGDGLLLSEGEFWRSQRRLIQPAFNRDRITGFFPLFEGETNRTISEWRALGSTAGGGVAVDIFQEMLRLTLRIIGKALFNRDLSDHARELGDASTAAIEETIHRMESPLKWPLFVPTKRNRRMKRALDTVNQVVLALIEERRQADSAPDDMLARLLAARDDADNTGMSDKQLRDEMITFLVAGHETTASALTWTWHLLSVYPETEARLREECVSVLNGRVPGPQDLAHLPYLRMVLDESMRLYPPAWMIERNALAQDELGGYYIPKNGIVSMSQWVVHRHPALWKNPHDFDPERFTAENIESRHKYAYFPFGGGQRLCIGNNFALMEASVILATLIQQFRLKRDPTWEVGLEPLITLRPKGGLRMILEAIG